MVLTESQSLQLTAILMEAAADRGDKKGFLAKAKEFLKRLLAIVKEKISKLKSFLKEKVKSLVDRIKFSMRVRKGEDPLSVKMDMVIDDMQIKGVKRRYEMFKESDAKLKNIVPEVTNLLKEVKSVLSSTGSESPEFKDSLMRLENAIYKIKFRIRGLENFSSSLSGGSVTQKIHHTQETKDSVKHADKLLRDIVDSIKGYEDLTNVLLGNLKESQSILEKVSGNLEKVGDSKTITVLSKVHSILGKLGSMITSGWAKIFSFVASLIRRKKKDDDEN